jgi:hypothetical protein
MKTIISAVALSGFLLGSGMVCGCRSLQDSTRASSKETATIELSGTAGAPITGYYICNGKRIELHGVLPMTIRVPGVSQLAVRKVNAQDNLSMAARGEDGSMGSSVPPGQADWMRLQLEGGMSISVILPKESLSPSGNSLIVIAPYWYEGTWVFDDARAGLSREPFVAGVPEIINALVKDIPGAREGFRLTFSPKPFPGFQHKLSWVRAESGGNCYRLADPPMEGWLCPAMFRYFSQAPKELYVKAEPKKS